MKKVLSLIACLSLTCAVNATIIDFDALAVSGSYNGALVEDGYDLNFNQMYVASGSTSTATTEIERLYDSNGTFTISESLGAAFEFVSIDWEWEYGEVANISLEGFFNGVSLGVDTFNSATNSYTTFASTNLFGLTIDTLVINADRSVRSGGSFDTLVLNESVNIPEPTSIFLLGLGLVGVVFSRKKNIKLF